MSAPGSGMRENFFTGIPIGTNVQFAQDCLGQVSLWTAMANFSAYSLDDATMQHCLELQLVDNLV